MNTKNINSVVYFLIVFFLGALGVHKFIDGKIGMGILYLLTAGLFGIGWLIDIIKSFIMIFSSDKKPQQAPYQAPYQAPSYAPYPAPQPNYNYRPAPQPPARPKEFGARDKYMLPEKIGECCLAYHYFIDLNEINIDILKRIEQDGNFNLSIDESGGIFYNGDKFAKIPNNNIVKMYHDWQHREWPCLCELNRASIMPLSATLRIGFYRDNDKYYGSKYNKKMTCRTAACFGDDKQAEIDSLEIGSMLTLEVEYNDETDNDDYLIYKSCCIGKLPKKAIEIDDEYGIGAITVADLPVDENGRTIPILNIYYSE